MMNATYVVGKHPPKKHKPKSVNHAITTLRRAFNWAIETERLPAGTNPFARVKKLACDGRQRVATEEEYQALLRHCRNDAFRDVLVAMRHTSARPQDVYSLTWAMVDWDEKMWVLEKHKTSRAAKSPKPRVIGMGTEVEVVLRARLEKYGLTRHVFLNSDGNPWNKDSLGLAMRRLRKQAGIRPNEQGEEFVLYTNRHTFLTKAGADPTISTFALTEVAGHTDPRTTARYVHAARQAIADAGRRVAGSLTGSGPACTGPASA
jgi:integrase